MAELAHSSSPGAPAVGGRHLGRPATLARWLFVVAGLILFMVAVGGITRLTESGLSITEWKPVTGTLPPMNEAQWQEEFDQYRTSSQYALMNKGMTLEAFKHIYFWEYFHRLVGRIIGLAYAVPLAWFALRRAIPRGFGVRLLVLLALGGAQGAVGWLMVKSGLVDRVNVQPAMLAAHLGMALILLGAVVWTACDFLGLARHDAANPVSATTPASLAPRRAVPTWAGAIPVLILFVQLLLGALTAGLRAGYVSNTWPMMNDRFVPDGIAWWGSLWMTLTSDPFLVHFLHRWWAMVAAGAMLWMAGRLHAQGALRLSYALTGATLVQVMLGIGTVLTGVSLHIAVTHQVTGALLLAIAVAGAHRLGQRDRESDLTPARA
ncbi:MULTISPECIES: COX15/CtaA family protein [unclassified Sphingobium]|uniref:COX15/CtaA family protein n=1 Tax=unclassified Sphingobium TaxID=2611147 RepID=UPI0022258EED|nr:MULTISPECIES: COX15/CtaA family protein [unclassified Sphingobium]MCW2410346.1 cytochrome c oxidase assembly protein subunit 15 [Sphingobium sp. B8D3D]MCW2413962.1 cytochrome c oxidase assembly protein subunit 15 [Sphingobium sp. B8D3A]